MARTESHASGSSTLDAALAVLRSPPRGSSCANTTRSPRKSEPYPDAFSRNVALAQSSPMTSAPPKYAFPSVLLRSASDSATATRSSLALLGPSEGPELPAGGSSSRDVAEPGASAAGPPSTVDAGELPAKRKKCKKKPAGYIPRPPNSFMLYRSAQLKALAGCKDEQGARLQQADLSRLIAGLWRDEGPEIREQYARQAVKEKEEHAKRYPDYAYRPKSRRKPSNEGSPLSTPASVSNIVAPSGLVVPASATSEESIHVSLPADMCNIPCSDMLLPPFEYPNLLSPMSPQFDQDFQNALAPPPRAAAEAWTAFSSAPVTWFNSAHSSAFDPALVNGLPVPPQSAPAGLKSFDFVPTPPPSSTMETPSLPNYLLPLQPPLTFDEFITSAPFSGVDFSSACGTAGMTCEIALPPSNALHLAALPSYDDLSLPEPPATAPPSMTTSSDPFDAIFQQLVCSDDTPP
ncbi:HMG-box domain-containing protein [Rhodotorula paludigena]|uniref:HMG-box domain-containing protein n=1 Tax=Rhodotorula paludigena TaxID=86838 RepID=UPI00317DEB26